MKDNKLSTKQQAFITAYLSNGYNATQAAITAGYSKNTAAEIGAENLRKPQILKAIKTGLDRQGITPKKIESAMGLIAFEVDMADYEPLLKGEMDLAGLKKAGVNTLMIRRLRISRRVVGKGDAAVPYEDVTIELHDRQKALEALARVHAMFRDVSIHQDGKKSWAQQIMEMHKLKDQHDREKQTRKVGGP